MKFEYGKKEDRPKCVAYIAPFDVLYVLTDDGCTGFFSDGEVCHFGSDHWSEQMQYATHKFYPGDKITITF